MIVLRPPFLVFMGDIANSIDAKTGCGLAHWRSSDCLGEFVLSEKACSAGLEQISLDEAVRRGVQTMVLGGAPAGGKLPATWLEPIAQAARCGLDIASGLHDRLSTIPSLIEAAQLGGSTLIDVRHQPFEPTIATGRKRSGIRILTVGTDCAVGKKYTALSLHRGLDAHGLDSSFRATGQTGIMIAGEGLALDTIPVDFAAGYAELLTPDNNSQHIDVIEGQGSLFHPAYAGLTLALIHGSQPDLLVLCHDVSRTVIARFPGYPVPPLPVAVQAYEAAAQLTSPTAKVIAISINSATLSGPLWDRHRREIETLVGLPCFDPLRDSEVVESTIGEIMMSIS